MSSNQAQNMRIGIIGTGRIAATHRVGYLAAGATIVAICDANPTALADRQKHWEVADGYTDYHDLLADPSDRRSVDLHPERHAPSRSRWPLQTRASTCCARSRCRSIWPTPTR